MEGGQREEPRPVSVETTLAAPSTEASRPKGRREELNNKRFEERRQAEELARRQREVVYVTSKGGPVPQELV